MLLLLLLTMTTLPVSDTSLAVTAVSAGDVPVAVERAKTPRRHAVPPAQRITKREYLPPSPSPPLLSLLSRLFSRGMPLSLSEMTGVGGRRVYLSWTGMLRCVCVTPCVTLSRCVSRCVGCLCQCVCCLERSSGMCLCREWSRSVSPVYVTVCSGPLFYRT